MKKAWEKIIERRLRKESEISQNQIGFMPGRGKTDACDAIRHLCIKYRAVHKNLHMVFIDLEKAYDLVARRFCDVFLRTRVLHNYTSVHRSDKLHLLL